MAHNVIKYRLTAEGRIPDFLYLGNDGVNGVYGVYDPNASWPRNLVQIGITKNDATGDFEIISTKADLLAYLSVIGANWVVQDPADTPNTKPASPFNPSAAADWVWGRFTTLNAAA